MFLESELTHNHIRHRPSRDFCQAAVAGPYKDEYCKSRHSPARFEDLHMLEDLDDSWK